MTENQILLIECCTLSFLVKMTALRIVGHKKCRDKISQTAEVRDQKIKPPLNPSLFMCFEESRSRNGSSQTPTLGMALLKRHKLKIEFRKP